MGQRTSGVRPARDSKSIIVDFYFQGVRCRERLNMDPTPRNLRYCENLRGQILREIELGIFEYAKYFPNSPKAKALTHVPGAAITVTEALKEWLSYTEPKVQHSTFIGYRRAVINVLIPSFGQLMLAKLTPVSYTHLTLPTTRHV